MLSPSIKIEKKRQTPERLVVCLFRVKTPQKAEQCFALFVFFFFHHNRAETNWSFCIFSLIAKYQSVDIHRWMWGIIVRDKHKQRKRTTSSNEKVNFIRSGKSWRMSSWALCQFWWWRTAQSTIWTFRRVNFVRSPSRSTLPCRSSSHHRPASTRCIGSTSEATTMTSGTRNSRVSGAHESWNYLHLHPTQWY